MMDKKIIFFDLDGTLLDQNKQIPNSARQAIQALKEKGHEVAIATGRAPFMFKKLRDELEIHTYVSFTGQYVVVNNEVIYQKPFPKEMLKLLIDFSSSNQHPLLYMGHEDMKTSIEYHPYIEESIATLKLDHSGPTYNPAYFEECNIYQLQLFCTKDEELPYATSFEQFRFIRWHPYSIDVLSAGESKAKGITFIMNKLGFTREQVYAFGDNLNDIEMLQSVGNGVAMGNAPDSVKKVAKHVTKDVNEDGIAYGLELVGLLKSSK